MPVNFTADEILVIKGITDEAVSAHRIGCPMIEAVDELRQGQVDIHKALEKITNWQSRLWSNGSGGPPGYLEVQQDKTDERFDQTGARFDGLERKISDLNIIKYKEEGAAEQRELDEENKQKAISNKRGWLSVILSSGVIVVIIEAGKFLLKFFTGK
jgi:hypothetical protein